MKKKLSLLIIFAVCIVLVIGILGACNKNPEVEYKDRSGVIFYLDGTQYYQLNFGGAANYLKDLIADGAAEPVWPEDPKKEGYEFVGWYITDSTGNNYKEEFTLEKLNAMLANGESLPGAVYARMQSLENPEYLVRFYTYDGKYSGSVMVAEGNLVPERAIPSIAYERDFVGWTTEQGNAEAGMSLLSDRVSADVELYQLFLDSRYIPYAEITPSEEFERIKDFYNDGYYFETYESSYALWDNFKIEGADWAELKAFKAFDGNVEVIETLFDGEAVTGYVLPLEPGENRFKLKAVYGAVYGRFEGVFDETEIVINRKSENINVTFDISGDGSRYQYFRGTEGEKLTEYPKPQKAGTEFKGWEIRDENGDYLAGQLFDPEEDVLYEGIGVLQAVFVAEDDDPTIEVSGTDQLTITANAGFIPEGTSLSPRSGENDESQGEFLGWSYSDGDGRILILRKGEESVESSDCGKILYILDEDYKLTSGWKLPDSENDENRITLQKFNKYTLTFKNISFEGEEVKGVDEEYDTYYFDFKDATLPKPYRVGYTFTGWYDEDGNKVTVIPADSTGNKTFSANWKPIEYYITYMLDGGTNAEGNPPKYDVEDDEIKLRDPTKEGYEFLGWYDENDTKVTEIPAGSTGDKTFWAKWELEHYTITLYIDDEKKYPMDPPTYTIYDEIVSLPTPPERQGYTFSGWYEGADPVVLPAIPLGSTGHKTFTAVWTPVEYKIKYILNGGTIADGDTDIYTVQQRVTLERPTREGYNFLGWYDNAAFEGEEVKNIPKGSTGDKTFYAKWTPEEYAITYNLDGGYNNAENPTSYNIESEINLEDPYRPGYTFKGWYDENDTKVTGIRAGSTGDREFRAKWEKNR